MDFILIVLHAEKKMKGRKHLADGNTTHNLLIVLQIVLRSCIIEPTYIDQAIRLKSQIMFNGSA